MALFPPPVDLLAAHNLPPIQVVSQRSADGAKEINQPAPQGEDARLHLRLSGDNLLSSGELALEALFPVYQANNQTLFAQGRIGKYRADTTLNLGIGQRWLMNQEWLLGYNLFYDTLWQKNHHSRVGVGIEARQEYFGMAINGYYPVSRWRKPEKSSFYSQRPARGMDMILHANLPAYPQLGASIKGEHYWDKNVQPLHNQPQGRSALTLGVNYTPISLVTAGYDYKIAKKGFKNQYQVHLSLNYRLGIPLEQQLDSSQVAQFRSLSGRLLEPVQRTNQVVLARRLEPKLIPALQALVNAGLVPGLVSGSKIDSNMALPDELIEKLASLNQTLLVACFDIMTLGKWDSDLDVVPTLITNCPSWPADTRLVIRSTVSRILLDGTVIKDTIPDQIFRPEGSNEIMLLLECGHYKLHNGTSAPINLPSDGNCFYYGILRGLKRAETPEAIRELRLEAAAELMRNPDRYSGFFLGLD